MKTPIVLSAAPVAGSRGFASNAQREARQPAASATLAAGWRGYIVMKAVSRPVIFIC